MRRIGAILAAALFAALAAFTAPAPGQEPADLEYRLGPKDLVEIKVIELPDLNNEYCYIGVAAGKTLTAPVAASNNSACVWPATSNSTPAA